MKFERLGNIIDIRKGKKPSFVDAPDKNSVRVLQIDDLRNDNKLKFTNDKTGVLANDTDVLIAWDGANAGTIGYGKSGFIGSTIALLRKKQPELYSTSFLGVFLQSQYDYLRDKSTGATIPHINRKALEELKIPVIDIGQQSHIANLLSKAENLIAQRKESITLLNEFLKSTFLEMFGDVSKMKNMKAEKLSDYIDFLTSGSRGWAKYYSKSGARFLRIQNVWKGTLRVDDMQHVEAPQTQEAIRTRVQEGDLLITITADLGRTAVVPKNFGVAYINQHIALVRLKKTINPIYAAYYYFMPFGYSAIQKKNKSAVKAGLTFNDITSLPIIVPSNSRQTQFSQIVEKTETLKTQYQQSLKELENLYGSLSQRAFKGELTLSKQEEQLLMAAEPVESSTIKQSNIPEKKRGFAKQVLGGKIISLFKDDKNFTHIKFQKLQYLAEHIAEEDLLWNYYRQAAGPYDNKFMHNVANKLKQNKWFEEKKYKFYPLHKVSDIDRYYSNYFSAKETKLSELFTLLKNASEKVCEAISTIYAVWNNHIILKQSFDKNKIRIEFFEWSNRKGMLFTEDEFEKALAWMQKHNIVPNGFGQLIKEKINHK